jgi:FkbM family methyltransferase
MSHLSTEVCLTSSDIPAWLEKIDFVFRSQSNPSFFTKLQRRTSWHWVKGDLLRIWRSIFRPDAINLDGVRIEGISGYSKAVRRELYSGRYEGAELSLLRSELPILERVLELGGGLGLLSSWAAKRAPSSKIWVVEANSQQAQKIQKLHYSLGLSSVETQVGAIGHGTGNVDFYFGEDFWESSTVENHVSKKAASTKVPVVDFSSLLLKTKPTAVICDIEGGEFDLFLSPSFRPEDFSSVRLVVLEVHAKNYTEQRVTELVHCFLNMGFSLKFHNLESHVWKLTRTNSI